MSQTPERTPVRDRWTHLNWVRKFQVAFRGLGIGITRTASFRVHLPVAVAVCGVAVWGEVDWQGWIALVFAIGLVITAELLNSAIETLSRAISQEENPWIRDALDIAAGGVLAASLVAMTIGVLVLGPRFWP
ncbi:MAG: diacylglycerol kinase [Planctomycetales bacterium]|nr:diacylglycerol kinase [Planctomycetales bacterium]